MTNPIPASTSLIDYWDSTATTKEFGHPLPKSIVDQYFLPGSAVLDVGCGYGRLSKQLSDLGFVVSGADISPSMLERAQQNVPTGDFRRYQDKLPWHDNTFDVAIMVTLLTSIPNASDQCKTMREVQRVLKPNGCLFVSDMPLQWTARYTERYANGLKKYGEYGVFDLVDGGTVRHHCRGYFMSLVSEFTCLNIESHNITTMNQNPAQAFRYVGRLA